MDDYPLTVEFPVHWGELDALGHVNHVRFLAWMETARMALFNQVGLPWENQPNPGPILANLNVNYLAPVHYPATVVCGVRVKSLGNTSFVLEYAVASNQSVDRFVATGTTVIVLYDYEQGSKVSIPAQLRNALDGFKVGLD